MDPVKGGCCFTDLSESLSPSLQSSLEASVVGFVVVVLFFQKTRPPSLLAPCPPYFEASSSHIHPSGPAFTLKLPVRSKLLEDLLACGKQGCLFTGWREPEILVAELSRAKRRKKGEGVLQGDKKSRVKTTAQRKTSKELKAEA